MSRPGRAAPELSQKPANEGPGEKDLGDKDHRRKVWEGRHKDKNTGNLDSQYTISCLTFNASSNTTQLGTVTNSFNME